MPLSGTLDVSPRIDEAPVARALATEPVTLERAEILYAMFEIDARDMEDLIPAALNPTIPPVVTFLAIKTKDSPLGTFTLAQTRVGCRAGVRPRGFVVGGYIDGDAGSAAMLSERWGFALEPAEVALERRYHDIVATVQLDGRPILDVSALDPVPLTGAEVLFASSMHLARIERDGEVVSRLVQVDPDFTFHRAARGGARLDAFDPQAWGEERLAVTYPVSAWYAVCDLVLPKVRYICDPDVPALQGTEKIE